MKQKINIQNSSTIIFGTATTGLIDAIKNIGFKKELKYKTNTNIKLELSYDILIIYLSCC